MRSLRLTVVALFCLSPILADVVTPTENVTSFVMVRQSPTTLAVSVGSLHPGEQVVLVGSVVNWYRVKLGDGTLGFVSKLWTRVIPATAPSVASPAYTVDVVDVGTGLGILVRGPDFTLVYDGGSNDDLARGAGNRMLAFLKVAAPTMTTIDELILSHPHRDHVELLPDLFAAYQVRQVWDSGRVNDICGYRAFLTAVRDEPGVVYHNALQDFGTQSFSFGASTCYEHAVPAESIQLTLGKRIDNLPIALGANAWMTILHADGGSYENVNDNSLVVRLDLGSTRVLLVGDSEAGGRMDPSVAPTATSVEGQLLACCLAELAARVLVAGHHGSKTSSRHTFLDAVGASVFLVSSGPTKYGTVTLPDAEVIAELSARGQVFRTDQNDAACAISTTKIGPVNDGKAGGCDNIRLLISDSAPLQVSVWHGN